MENLQNRIKYLKDSFLITVLLKKLKMNDQPFRILSDNNRDIYGYLFGYPHR